MSRIALAVIAATTVAACSSVEYDSQQVCISYGEELLKHPAGAEWTFDKGTEEGDSWRWEGHVDAPNSFGAPVRAPFICRADMRFPDTPSIAVKYFMLDGEPQHMTARMGRSLRD